MAFTYHEYHLLTIPWLCVTARPFCSEQLHQDTHHTPDIRGEVRLVLTYHLHTHTHKDYYYAA